MEPIPVDLSWAAANPSPAMVAIAEAMQGTIDMAIQRAKHGGVDLSDCRVQWVNILDSEVNPFGHRGHFRILFSGARRQPSNPEP
jgi:hypothetical protein